MKIIPLTRVQFALVDDDDYEWLNQWSWQYAPENQTPGHQGRTGYARAVIRDKNTTMHAFIMGRRDGYVVDHKDRNGLNNQRDNLRWATYSQNSANAEKRRSATASQYKGVYHRPKCTKPWVSIISFNKQLRFLGYFIAEEEAAHAYDRAALELYGEYACLNFSCVGIAT